MPVFDDSTGVPCQIFRISPAGSRSVFLRQPDLKVVVSPSRVRLLSPAGLKIVVPPAEVCVGSCVPSKSGGCCFPDRGVRWKFSPARSPSGSSSVEVIPSKGCPFPSSGVIPSRVEIGEIPGSSAELLVSSPEGDTFYTFII